MEVVGVDERMAVGALGGGGLDEVDVVHADAGELGGAELSGRADVAAMLGGGRDGGDPQQGLQLVYKTRLIGLRKLYRRRDCLILRYRLIRHDCLSHPKKFL